MTMTIHFRDDVEDRNDATLRVIRGGMRGGAVVRIDLHTDKHRGGYLSFSLTPKEVAMLKAELDPAVVEMPKPECFHDDHVPGCEHATAAATVDWFDIGVAILGMGPTHDPECPAFHGYAECGCGAEPDLGSDRLNP